MVHRCMLMCARLCVYIWARLLWATWMGDDSRGSQSMILESPVAFVG